MIPLFIVCHVPLLCLPSSMAWATRVSRWSVFKWGDSAGYNFNRFFDQSNRKNCLSWTWIWLNLLRGIHRIRYNPFKKEDTKELMGALWHFSPQDRQGKRRTYSLAYFIEKHSRGWLLFFESMCCKNRPASPLALRCFSRCCQVISCTFPPFLIEQFKVTLECLGVTVIVWKGCWHFCALISQSRFPVVDTSIG